jgi:hypothetical protein
MSGSEGALGSPPRWRAHGLWETHSSSGLASPCPVSLGYYCVRRRFLLETQEMEWGAELREQDPSLSQSHQRHFLSACFVFLVDTQQGQLFESKRQIVLFRIFRSWPVH